MKQIKIIMNSISKEELQSMIDNGDSYEKIGRLCGVSGNAIRKRAKLLGIELPKRRKINQKETFNKGKKEYTNKCLFCGSPIPSRNKFCSVQHKNEYEAEKTVEKWFSGEDCGCGESGDMREPVRKYILKLHNYSCDVCGCNYINPFTGKTILEIHHIDGDCYNNNLDNIQVLCPNHHHMTENYGSRNKNSSRIDRRTKYFRESMLNKNKE